MQVFQGFSDIVNMKIVDPQQVYDWTVQPIVTKIEERQNTTRSLQNSTVSNGSESDTEPTS
jgi:hypothetical protein